MLSPFSVYLFVLLHWYTFIVVVVVGGGGGGGGSGGGFKGCGLVTYVCIAFPCCVNVTDQTNQKAVPCNGTTHRKVHRYNSEPVQGTGNGCVLTKTTSGDLNDDVSEAFASDDDTGKHRMRFADKHIRVSGY